MDGEETMRALFGHDKDRIEQMEMIECFCEPFDQSGFRKPEQFGDIWPAFQADIARGERPYAYIEGTPLIGKTNLVKGFAASIGAGDCIPFLRGREVMHVLHEATSPDNTPESEAFEEFLKRFADKDCPKYILYTDDMDAAKALLALPGLAIPVIAELRNNGTIGVINRSEFIPDSSKGIGIYPGPDVGEDIAIMQGLVADNREHYTSRYGQAPADDVIEVITRMMLAKASSYMGFRPSETMVVLDNLMSEYTSGRSGSPTVDDAYAFAKKDFGIDRETLDGLPDRMPDAPVKTGRNGDAPAGADDDDGLVFSDRADLLKRLKERVIGQDKALEDIVAPLVRRKAGLGDTDRPIASLLLAGPSGVGKTETAKALAEAAFGDPGAFKRIDCGEMVNEMGVSRLLGSSQGYVSFDSGGELSNFISSHPHSVILFDEIEKASDRFYDSLFLQLMSAGRITGSVRTVTEAGPKGVMRTVDASGCIIIMTSNIGSQTVGDLGMNRMGFGDTGDDSALLEDSITDEVCRNFRIEFVNRLDGIIVFHPLDMDSLRKVFMLKWRPNERRIMERRGMSVDMDGSVPTWFAELSRKDRMGARNLIRAMDDKLINPMADIMLEQHKDNGGTLHVSVSDDGKELDIS